MKEKWLKIVRGTVLSLTMFCALFAGSLQSRAYDAGTKILLPYGKLQQNCVWLGAKGTYVTQASDALRRINEIRLEACKEGIVCERTGEPLTEADYAPVEWSATLETIARFRAAEASLRNAHDRPNGGSCWDFDVDGALAQSEVLAWNESGTMLPGIEQWYEEKKAWVNHTPDAVTGHYTAMIDPIYTHVGLGCFLSEGGSYYNTTCGRFASFYTPQSTQPQAGVQNCIQTVDVLRSALVKTVIRKTSDGSQAELNIGETSSYECLEETYFYDGWVAKAQAVVLDPSWNSSALNVARVDNYGKVTAYNPGNATVTATSSDGLEASVSITVTSKVTSISIPKNKNLTAGKIATLKAAVKPQTAVNKSLSWTSGSKSVATVSQSGKVTARKPGKAVITAKAKDGSGVKATCTVIVTPKKMTAPSLSQAGKKKLKVRWKKQSGISGYQIQYGLKKSFKGAKTKNVSSGKSTLTLSKLKKNKIYYTRIRAYKKIGEKTYYGSWSSSKKLKVR